MIIKASFMHKCSSDHFTATAIVVVIFIPMIYIWFSFTLFSSFKLNSFKKINKFKKKKNLEWIQEQYHERKKKT